MTRRCSDIIAWEKHPTLEGELIPVSCEEYMKRLSGSLERLESALETLVSGNHLSPEALKELQDEVGRYDSDDNPAPQP